MWLKRAVLLGLLVAVTALSQFYRVSNSVIAPELARELGLSAEQLGWAGSAFFAALLALQLPVGIWFDRYGARLTVAVLSLLAVAGAALLARAESAEALIAARALVGLGCAASFMSVVFLCSRWFPPDRLTTVLSWVFAASNLGTLAAATPLALAASALGWRNSFLVVSAVTALVAALFFLFVRDRPPDADARAGHHEGLADILGGVIEVLRTPGLWPILAMHAFAYASMLTVLGIWAGPYLNDVHGLDGVARGNVILAMGAAQIAGILLYGPMDRIVGSRKRVVITGASLSALTLIALGLLSQPPQGAAVALLVAFTLFAGYPVVIVAQGRALFPDRLAGRGVTTVNMAQLVGLVLLPSGSGQIIGAFAAGGVGVPESAYRAVFLALAACLMLGLSFYLRSRDTKPAATGSPDP
ncbi:MAG: MFS transporter [Alphaproteobacteria bacterium]|nr:MFS transporter [Alphaproteobacteria bacterium]